MPPQTIAATPDARYKRVGRPGLIPADRRAQALALAALTLGLGYLAWRWGWTLDSDSLWIGLPLVLAETYGLVMMVLLSFSCWRLADRPLPPPLPGRDVAVLIATFDESQEVLRPTVLGALELRHEPAPVVWVLDDGARPWVRLMCEDLGARYICRPAPRSNAKAGNINHALGVVDAEFLVTLDADHVPRPELLELSLGYLADPKVAVVQGPQAFYNRGFQHPREEDDDPLYNDQSIFFDVICRGKDRHNAAFWCGCPTVIRREALVSVGGVATETVVEDAHTTLRLHKAGWRTVFQPRVLALGLAPEDIAAYVVQRSRWARGSLQMMRRGFPLLARGLSWRQRLEYTASTLHFLEGPQRLVALLIPPLVLATGVTPIAASPLLYATLFFPQFVLMPLTSWAITRGRYRLVDGERYAVVRMEGYLRAMRALVRGGGAKFTVTPKGARAEASVGRALRLPIFMAVVSGGALAYQVAAQALLLPGMLSPGAYVITSVWALLNIAIISAVYVWARGVHHRRRSHRFPVALEAAYAADARQRPTLSARVEDLSQTGAGVRVVEPAELGSRLRLVLLLDDGPVDVVGTVAGVRPLGDGWHLGVDFDPLQPGVGDAIGRWCFLHPFGPGAEVRIAEVGRPRRVPMEQPATLALAEVAATVAKESRQASTG